MKSRGKKDAKKGMKRRKEIKEKQLEERDKIEIKREAER